MEHLIKSLKIALAGSAGTGKTDLMEALAAKYGLTKVQVDTMHMIPAGVQNHTDLIRLSTSYPQEGITFQTQLLEARAEAFLNAEGGFISDQSVVDSYAYYAIHNSMFANSQLDFQLSRATVRSVVELDMTVVLIPDLSISGIADNGIRLNSLPYYRAVSSIILNTLQDIMKSQEGVVTTSLPVTDCVTVHIATCPTTSLVFIDEASCVTGITTIENRIKAIELALSFIKLSKTKDESNVETTGHKETSEL